MSRRPAKPKKIDVSDATRVIQGIEQFVSVAEDPHYGPPDRMARSMLDGWRTSPVMLRFDDEFLGALLNSDEDVEITTSWMKFLPFDYFAGSLVQPLEIELGGHRCRVHGFLASGLYFEEPPGQETLDIGEGRGMNVLPSIARYVPVTSDRADKIRFLWAITIEDDPRIMGQPTTLSLRDLPAGATLEQMINAQGAINQAGGEDPLPKLLYRMALLILMFLASQGESDIEEPPADNIARAFQLSRAEIKNVGWRTGAALREHRRHGDGEGQGQPGHGGWRMPPHMRKAHPAHRRYATRDASGKIVGNVHGERPEDWDYILIWIMPTPVNAKDRDIDPVVRKLE